MAHFENWNDNIIVCQDTNHSFPVGHIIGSVDDWWISEQYTVYSEDCEEKSWAQHDPF